MEEQTARSLSQLERTTAKREEVIDRRTFYDTIERHHEVHQTLSQTLQELVQRVAQLERSRVSHSELNAQLLPLQEMQQIQPLTTMDVLQIVQEQLHEHDVIRTLSEENLQRMMAAAIDAHPIRLAQLSPRDAEAFQQQMVEGVKEELQRILYEDNLGKPDFALSAMGAKVMDYSGKWTINNLIDKVLPFGEITLLP